MGDFSFHAHREDARGNLPDDSDVLPGFESRRPRDIEVSGAIGICKFNKIMLLSPRNLARGYRWTDALSHEYIHYIVVQLSHNRAPIWLHEGIAKYFESAWRLPSGGLAGPSLREPARPCPQAQQLCGL